MSTRCQVQVRGGDGDKRTLYHHTDGYPTRILRLIQRAFELSGGGWEAAHGGKVASFLCAADPGVFEPEAGHALHGDIEWYYILHANGEMHIGAKPEWRVTVYEITGLHQTQKKVCRATLVPLGEVVQQAEALEMQAQQA